MASPKKAKYQKPVGPPPKDATEFFKYRIDTMMKNPDKEMKIPDMAQPRGPPQPKDFFRNVMGGYFVMGPLVGYWTFAM